MKKLFAFFRIEINQTLMYRLETLVWFVLEFSGIVPVTFLWLYLGAQGQIEQATVNYLICYYILTVIITRVTASHFEENEINEIKDGNISSVFLKPIDYASELFVREIAWRVSGLVFVIPTLVLVFIFMGSVLATNIHLNFILPAAFILAISLLQRLWVSWLITIATFWMDQSKSLIHLKWMLEGILGGQWLPMIFFPLWVQNVAKYLPFYYWYNFPIDILMGRVSLLDHLDKLAIHLLWLGLLWFLGRYMWKQAIKRYSAVGG